LIWHDLPGGIFRRTRLPPAALSKFATRRELRHFVNRLQDVSAQRCPPKRVYSRCKHSLELRAVCFSPSRVIVWWGCGECGPEVYQKCTEIEAIFVCFLGIYAPRSDPVIFGRGRPRWARVHNGSRGQEKQLFLPQPPQPCSGGIMKSRPNKSNTQRAAGSANRSVRELAWNRLSAESAVAFAAFKIYRDMNPLRRSLRAVADRLRRNLSLIERWSSRHAWVQRTRAWEDERHRIETQAQEVEWIAQAKQRAARMYRERNR
jgi:hypothetical protein